MNRRSPAPSEIEFGSQSLQKLLMTITNIWMKKAPSKGKLRELAVETHTLSKVLEQHAEQ